MRDTFRSHSLQRLARASLAIAFLAGSGLLPAAVALPAPEPAADRNRQPALDEETPDPLGGGAQCAMPPESGRLGTSSDADAPSERISSVLRQQIATVGHSAGSIWMGRLLECWESLKGPAIDNLILYAPACTAKFFGETFGPAIRSATVARMHHFLLDDKREQDDNVATIYRKSLLYLVSRSFQNRSEASPQLGMENYLPETMAELVRF